MMTHEEIALLQQPEIRMQIARLRDQSPERVALSLREHQALIATQIKYLQRARTKLPSYYEHGCILTPLAFEQCSSEATAAIKEFKGEKCLDLTCGLGVDSFYLSKHFKQVFSLEQVPELAEIARYNFSQLGATNITVIASSAENYLNQLQEETSSNSFIPFDLIYIDPARRDTNGKKVWLLEDCSPNIISLLPTLNKLSHQVIIKASPLFDISEAFRIFGSHCAVEIVSLHGECKEVRIFVKGFTQLNDALCATSSIATTGETLPSPLIRTTIADPGAVRSLTFPYSSSPKGASSPTEIEQFLNDPATGQERYLLIPDVSLYKGRVVTDYATQCGVLSTSATGYCFSREIPTGFFGRIFPIQSVSHYQPKNIKRFFKEQQIKSCTIMKKDFPFDTDAILRALGVRQGGTCLAAFTQVNGHRYVLTLTPELTAQ